MNHTDSDTTESLHVYEHNFSNLHQALDQEVVLGSTSANQVMHESLWLGFPLLENQPFSPKSQKPSPKWQLTHLQP